ncbi:MAG: ADP-ribosylglycohydrolase family protein [Cellulosilyticaceae bacterium]
MKRDEKHYVGCLIGGAIGDAWGAPVEFMKLSQIRKLFGEDGLTHLVAPAGTSKAVITDDTQMTLFTAEGILRSIVRANQKNIERTTKDTNMLIFRAYLRWLYTQGLSTPNWDAKNYDGWLVKVGGLHAYREPGVTCITSLGKGIMGTMFRPINDSKGCGTVMRVAPIGLMEKEAHVFELGCMSGAITHGHPEGYLAGGAMALLIYHVIEGDPLEEAVQKVVERLGQIEEGGRCVNLLTKAVTLAKEGDPSAEKLTMLGEGFAADEALAIGIYAALSYPDDFEKAICLAINHDGDSDTTGAITGNLMGASLGLDGIAEVLLDKVELSKEIIQIGKDLARGYDADEAWQKRYPGW